MKRRDLLLTSIACAGLGFGLPASAQITKPVRMLVGFPAGGSIDTVARVLAEKMKDELKQPVFIDNKPGAGGRLAAELLKNAAPDGSTIMITPLVVPVLAPMVFNKLNYAPATDFAPIGRVCNFQFGMAVNGNAPIKNVNEFIAWLKAHPQQANFGSPAPGSLPHFFGVMMGREAQIEMVHVPYGGGAALQTALAGGQITSAIDVVLEHLEFHKAGKSRILATSGMQRSKVLPDVPTFREAGFPNLVGEGWFAMYAPARTPDATVSIINRALNKALASPEVIDRFSRLALEAAGGTPAELLKLHEADTQRWGPVVKASGFRAD